MKQLSRLTRFAVIAAASLCFPTTVFAGFLEMPDTSEVPELERQSMLKDLDIPSVRDRDPDPMSGPRLNITEFRVQGIVEYPELGITRASLTKLVEGIRFDLMGEGEMLDSGYTLDEVSEISDMIAEIEEETQDAHVSPLDVQRLVFLIRDQRKKRGVTVGMIEAVADTITRYYRERGFILAKAYIPEQRVRDGVVTLTLLLGDLGDVKVHNNQLYSAKTIEKIFRANKGKPVKADTIEERLFFVNDMPGLSAQAYFEPGSQVGDTRLSLNVLSEDEYSSNIRIDNHGSQNTGEYRIYIDGYWNNPAGIGDQLYVGILATMDPSNSLYGSIHYGIPLFSQRAKFTFGGSTNDFVSNSINGLSLTGKSELFDASLNYIFKRSRIENYSLEWKASQIKTDIEQTLGNSGTSQEILDSSGAIDLDTTVRNMDFIFNFDVLLENIRALHQGGVRLTFTDVAYTSNAKQNRNPVVLAANYSLLKFFKVPFTSAQSRAVMKVAGQVAEGGLPSTSQFSLTGPNKMRGLNINQYSADTGIYGSVDWIFNAPAFLSMDIAGSTLSKMLQPYVFVEAAYGDASPSAPAPGTWAGIADVGMGLKLSFKNSLRAGISVAKVVYYLRDDGYKPYKEKDSLEGLSNIYFDLQYSF